MLNSMMKELVSQSNKLNRMTGQLLKLRERLTELKDIDVIDMDVKGVAEEMALNELIDRKESVRNKMATEYNPKSLTDKIGGYLGYYVANKIENDLDLSGMIDELFIISDSDSERAESIIQEISDKIDSFYKEFDSVIQKTRAELDDSSRIYLDSSIEKHKPKPIDRARVSFYRLNNKNLNQVGHKLSDKTKIAYLYGLNPTAYSGDIELICTR